ncbi:SipW-dependent-type signal peptide-containing protein [Microbacterium maritypicum]
MGAVDGATFSNHATAGTAATLNFQLVPTAMAPGNSTYALFSVKTANPSVAGTVQLIAGTPTGTGLAAHLTCGVRTIAGTTCNSTTYAAGTAVVADGSALTAGGATTQAVTANGATQVNYCFAVTLPLAAPNAAQGLTMTQTWQFLGTSS